MRWLGEAVGKMVSGDHVLSPRVRVLADEQLTGPALEMVQARLDLWLAAHIKKWLGPLQDLEKGEGLEGMGRGIAFQVAESLGVLERGKVADDVKSLDQDGRAALRKVGIRFGAYHIYMPALLKPAPRALAAQLWALKHGGIEGVAGIEEVPHLAASGRTSFAADKAVPKGFYRAAGFRVCGERCVRVDILERLADLIRPAIAYRPGVTAGEPPAGSADGEGFVVTVAMTSLAGCSGEAFSTILRSLGYQSDKRAGPAITVPLLAEASREALKPVTEASTETPSEAPTDVAAPVEEAAPVEQTPVEASAETPAADVASETEAAVVAEPELIEVWRPHRVNRGQRPERGKGRPQHARGGQKPAEGQPATEGGAEGQKREDRRGKFANFRREGEGRPDNRGGRPPQKGGKGRSDRNDQRRGSDRTFASTEKPAGRERQPDPNSPFAKLLALKGELEAKKKD
jgi:ATP-dependent RNA helicase SUPV3L1/SUV3